jgi:hypothetical protein
MMKKQKITNPDTWFEELIGFPETEFGYTREEIPKKYHDLMGTFEQLSIAQLKAQIDFTNPNNPTNSVKLNVYYRDTYDSHTELFDTSGLQYNAKPGTLFQVASNFNCLENASKKTNVFNGYLITGQMTDTTQGPSASAGAAFGAILRLIKHKAEPINLLTDTPIKQNNGKVEYNNERKLDISTINPEHIRVGLHRNVTACFVRDGINFAFNAKGPKINQVFTSTCICDNNTPNQLSRILLEAAYDATYLCAIITKAPEVVLTMIGGGVFNNNHGVIIDAIMRAHNKYAPYLVKECIVKLPIYVPTPYAIIKHLKKYNESGSICVINV